MHFDPNDRQSLTARVYEHIREDIIEGRYANGAYLVETKLAEELDVSRTPIREALKQLELEDLVVSIPNRGVMVQGMSSHDIDDIFTVRYLLEGQAAYWAAERIDEANLARLTEIVELMEMYTRKNDSCKPCPGSIPSFMRLYFPRPTAGYLGTFSPLCTATPARCA